MVSLTLNRQLVSHQGNRRTPGLRWMKWSSWPRLIQTVFRQKGRIACTLNEPQMTMTAS